MRGAIWYHLYNLKNMKNTHGGVLLLVKLEATLLKVTLLHGCFSRFLNCTNGTKWCKTSHYILTASTKIHAPDLINKVNLLILCQ